MKYLIQIQLDSAWHTVAARSRFADAKAKALREARAMNYAHPVSVIREGDDDLLRRHASAGFKFDTE